MYFYCQFFFVGQIIYDIGGLCRIAPPNFADLYTILQSDVRGGSSTPWGRLETQAWGARTPKCAFKSPSLVETLSHGAQFPPKPGLAPRTEWTQVHQKRLRQFNRMCKAAQENPGGDRKREHGAHAHPSGLSSRPLHLKT